MLLADVERIVHRRGVHAFASVAAVMVVVTLVFLPTARSIVDIWARSDTFAHGFLVPPAVLWFVWSLRAELAATPARRSLVGLLALAACVLLWLFGELASALAPTHWAMVAMVPSSVLALFGWGWLRVLAFPLIFLFFAVPFGEAFVPTLIDWTADFTVSALLASGIPVLREGNDFVIPTGRWSVVEACSGIRYLIASTFAGVLYSWIVYRSPLKRTLFIGASVLVPLVANWFRAYLIVMIGHLSGNRIATGVDHLIYGWVFFGLVIGLMFLVGARWREDHNLTTREGGLFPSVVERRLEDRLFVPSLWLLAAVLATMVSGPVAHTILAAFTDKRPLDPSPILEGGGWTASRTLAADWMPSLEGPVGTQSASFVRGDTTVTVYVGWYRGQHQGSELVNSMNRLLRERDTPWHAVARGTTQAEVGSTRTGIRTATLRRPGQSLRVWHWYWFDGALTTSDTRAKLALAVDRVLGRSDTSAWVAVSTSSEDGAEADRVLRAFLRDMGPSLLRSFEETAAR